MFVKKKKEIFSNKISILNTGI